MPLTVVYEEGYSYRSFTHGGGGYNVPVPEKKYLAAELDVGDLRQLAESITGKNEGLSFYISFEIDGQTRFLNRDGFPGRDFDIRPSEIRFTMPPGFDSAHGGHRQPPAMRAAGAGASLLHQGRTGASYADQLQYGHTRADL